MLTKKSLVLALILAVLSGFLMNEVSNAQSMPGVSVSANKKSFKAGDSGILTIKFKTGNGVKIPKEPPIDVTITSDNINGQGVQDYTGGEGDYLTNNLVKYKFTVPDNTEAGDYTVTGTVKFGYCSSESGVCKLGNKSFSVKIKVK
ncbi:MAG: hypothetical protein NTV87_11385 [Ignavibacteriae bacterium]|nr:hypothetical protein [Ignavibacteriota bacterium]